MGGTRVVQPPAETGSPNAVSGRLRRADGSWRWDAVIVVIAVLAAQGGMLLRALVWDDLIYCDHLELAGRWRLLSPDPFGFVRPGKLLMLSMLHALFGRASAGWQGAGLLAAVCASLAVWRLASRLLVRSGALLAAVVYAVHPFHVEGAGWASAANGTWMTALAVGYYILFMDGDGRWGVGRCLAATALFVGSLALKEEAVVLPLVAVVLIWGSGRLRDRRALVVAGVHLCLAGAFVLFNRWQAAAGLQELEPFAYAPWIISLSAPRNILAHMVYFVWPFRWAYYAVPVYTPPVFYAGLLVGWLAAAVLAAWAWRRLRDPVLPLAFVLFSVLALVPTSNLLPTGSNLFGVRFLSHAGTGLALLAGWTWQTAASRQRRPRPAVVGVFWIGWCLAAVAACWVFHWGWRAGDPLFARIARVNPHPQSYVQRAIPRFDAGRLDEVEDLMNKALDAESRARGRAEADAEAMHAAGLHALARRVPPPSTAPWIILGMVRFDQGRYEDAADLWHRAEAIEPYDVDLAVNLARDHERRFETGRSAKDLAAAERYYRIAVQGSTPNAETAYLNLGVLLATTGREGEAVPVWEEGLDRFPGSASLRTNLSIARGRAPATR